MKRSFAYAIIILLISSESLHSQTSREDPVDLQAWYIAGMGLNLPKKWDAGLTVQVRTENNAADFRGFYLTPEAGYKITKKSRAFLNYRHAWTNNGSSSRVGLGFEYTFKPDRWKFDIRPQIQYTIKYADDGELSSSKWILRTRVGISYEINKKLDAYIQFEPFFTFDRSEYFIDNIRNTAGLKYEYAKNKKVSVFYIYRPDFAKSYDRTFHVIGLKLDFDWKTGRSGKSDKKI